MRNKEESRAIPRFLDRQLVGFTELEKMDGRGTIKIKCAVVSKQHLQRLWDMQVDILSRQWEVRSVALGRCWARATSGHQHKQTDKIFKKQAWMVSWGSCAGGGGPGQSSGAPPPLGQGLSA